ncbi:ribosome silencing factor [Megasphaera lornae]|uniref:Ribosomal silencing factor RsfS n=1 Tax=Megasphaera lornae TaxID=1000568 RepID=D3LTY4_9FIRM|nr:MULTISPECIES: ribosome silencing factor [Megasphaera]EFD94355.1 iojap-like protein [Megasphaera genomosp. type_1 str. 28L]EGL41136.1 iojap-like protein [Megasphaera lornae]MUP49531.1 ribosome silencing factor [Veillonellaceae bacterium M1-70]
MPIIKKETPAVQPCTVYEIAAQAADEKKAWNITILNIEESSLMADYFVICSVRNERMARSVADAVEEALALQGHSVTHKEGYHTGKWILLDAGIVVIHIFVENERQYYGIEDLWGDAKRIPFAGE